MTTKLTTVRNYDGQICNSKKSHDQICNCRKLRWSNMQLSEIMMVKPATVKNYSSQICNGEKSQRSNMQLSEIMIVKPVIVKKLYWSNLLRPKF